ncbi:MAG: type II toxin-antitoxin system RelE/ParE family toxin [Bacteroidota bacterium]
MAWKIRISASANKDIKDIKKWYKEKSFQTLENFTNELIEAIENLKRDTIEYKTVYGGYKRAFLNKFPYTIYYQRKEKENIIEINAVFHNRRDKDIITKRFEE